MEITDDQGTAYRISAQGSLSEDKITRMLEILNLLDKSSQDRRHRRLTNESTVYGKISGLIESNYARTEFSSADIARDYEELYAAPIPLSTVSTYLGRLTDRLFLKRQKFGNSWVYRISSESTIISPHESGPPP